MSDESGEGVRVGEVGNYYGGLHIRKHEGGFQWGIENYDGFNWYDISEDLYHQLVMHELKREHQRTWSMARRD